ncbi:hypothetical protein ANO11243_066720 [Dothideomycetidae sp. 11243]|nr:hypothetical protein ANO11243_066720 [fungal sp. No.11243]
MHPSRGSNKPKSPVDSTCNTKYQSTIKKNFYEPQAFCRFYDAFPRGGGSPIPGVTAEDVMDGCACYDHEQSVTSRSGKTRHHTTQQQQPTAAQSANDSTSETTSSNSIDASVTGAIATGSVIATTATTVADTPSPSGSCGLPAPTALNYKNAPNHDGNEYHAVFTSDFFGYSDTLIGGSTVTQTQYPGTIEPEMALYSCAGLAALAQNATDRPYMSLYLINGLAGPQWFCEMLDPVAGHPYGWEDLGEKYIECAFGYQETVFTEV